MQSGYSLAMSVLLMKSIYWFNGDCWMTWLWPVGMRGSWAFTMNWTEWHIYQVTARLFLPSCWMNSLCECLWENSFRFRSPQKERVLTQKLFLSLKVSSLTILIACAMIHFPPNFPLLKWIIFLKSVSDRSSLICSEYSAVGIEVGLFYNLKWSYWTYLFRCFYSMCVFQRVLMY